MNWVLILIGLGVAAVFELGRWWERRKRKRAEAWAKKVVADIEKEALYCGPARVVPYHVDKDDALH